MTRRISLLLVAALVTACTGAEAAPSTVTTTTTTVPTTTTTAPTTTTTLQPVVEVEGADDGLGQYLAVYYGIASGRSTDAEALAAHAEGPLLPQPGSRPDLPTVEGVAAVADYRGSRIAVFESGDDLLGLVDDGDGWRLVAGRAPSIGVDAWYSDDPILLAVVGSDARKGEDVSATRADSIHIVGMDGRGGAAVVGIPRDSWVPIPGYGTSKINASLQAGGPEMMMAAFEELSGLELDGYALTGFEGFERMVDDALGPFEIDIPFTYSDRSAKADFAAGVQVVDGRDALAFARTRKAFASGDFQRQFNGGLVLIAALGGAKLRGPLAFPEIIAGTEEWLITDLSPEQMLRFALAANEVKLTEISNLVLAGSNATTSGGASIVRLDQSALETTFADLADGTLD
jgi:polyisoprenyl-teichoic acid--peptidoglycan teichoic acid transferase